MPYLTQEEMKKIMENEPPNYAHMLEQVFNFERWGFRQILNKSLSTDTHSVVYESEWCRVHFRWVKPDIRDGYSTSHVFYGRLHAPANEMFMMWNGEKCHCWHDVRFAIKYLDNITPQVVAENKYGWPQVMEQFIQSNRDSDWSEIKWVARTHHAAWKHYGKNLFEIFDLRRPDIWETYSAWIKEVHLIDNEIYKKKNYRHRPTYGKPTIDKIC